MSRGKKLMGLALVLVVLAVAAFAATKLNPDNQTEEESPATSILALDADSVTALSWDYGGESLAFENNSDGWVYTEDPSFPLNTASMDSLLFALSDVTSGKTIENAEDLSQYGLDTPTCAISVTAGETYQLLLGDTTALDGDVYCSIGDGNVYLVDAGLLDSFSVGLLDLVEKETIPDMSDVVSLSLVNESGSMALAHSEVPVSEDTGSEDSETADEEVWTAQQADGPVTLDTDLTEALVEQVTGLTWGDCVDYKADESALTAYGLDASATVATVVYTTADGTEASFVLELGTDTADGSYARIAGSAMVYLIDTDTAAQLRAVTAQDLLAD
jgi:hypothetical protein